MKSLKKGLAALVVCSLCAGSVFGQFSNGGSADDYTYGKVGIGTTSPEYGLHIKGNAWNTTGLKMERTVTDGGTWGPLLYMTSSSSGEGSNSARMLGGIYFQAATDANTVATGAVIRATTKGNWGTSSTPTSLEFYTNSNGNYNYLSPDMIIDKDGKVGVGTSSPYTSLHVAGSACFGNGNSSKAFIRGNNGYSNSSNPDYTWFNNDQTGFFHPSLNNIGVSIGGTEIMRVTSEGVGIRTSNTRGYDLAVKGQMLAEAIDIIAYSNWPDYVFAEDYNLKSLDEVEDFIEQNNHLPDVPSANDMKDKSVNVAEMDALLLQKIEELTLYVLELKNENKQQQVLINSLTKD